MSKASKTMNKPIKPSRRRHTAEFKQEALALAARIGIAKAATQLGIAESQLYYWRTKGREQMTQTEREQQQATEVVRLKRELAEHKEELAILKKAMGYFARESR
jgi:transposase